MKQSWLIVSLPSYTYAIHRVAVHSWQPYCITYSWLPSAGWCVRVWCSISCWWWSSADCPRNGGSSSCLDGVSTNPLLLWQYHALLIGMTVLIRVPRKVFTAFSAVKLLCNPLLFQHYYCTFLSLRCSTPSAHRSDFTCLTIPVLRSPGWWWQPSLVSVMWSCCMSNLLIVHCVQVHSPYDSTTGSTAVTSLILQTIY